MTRPGTSPPEKRMAAKVFREFAYRWACPSCGQDNLSSDEPVLKSRCDLCGHSVDLVEIVYDNGAVCILDGREPKIPTFKRL